METELIEKLIDMFNTTSPKLWEIAEKQVNVKISNTIMLMILSLVILGISIYFLVTVQYKNNTAKYKNSIKYVDDYSTLLLIKMVTIIVGVAALVSVVIAVINLNGMILNPDYYTLEAIINLVK